MMATGAIAEGVDVFGSSMEKFVNDDTGFFIGDAGVFEAKVGVWLGAGS